MSPHLITLLLLLMPQSPPINVTINIYADNVYIGVPTPTPPTPAPAITDTNCDTLMEAWNALAGQADPFERTTGEFDLGEACAGGPGVANRT